MKIADVHAHVFPEKIAEKASASIADFYNWKIERPASMDSLEKYEREAGISRYVISSSAVTAKQVFNINTFIAEETAKRPNCLGFGSVFPGMDGIEEELDRMLELGLTGIKIHPDFQKVCIDDEKGIDTYRAIAKRGMPVLFHMGDNRDDFSSPERLTNLLRRVPDLRVIAAHFGGWTVWEESYNHPQPENVMYDTSSTLFLVEDEFVLRMIERFGPERLMFGSDFPMWSPKEIAEKMMTLGLDEKTMERIFYGNYMSYFGLSDDDSEHSEQAKNEG